MIGLRCRPRCNLSVRQVGLEILQGQRFCTRVAPRHWTRTRCYSQPAKVSSTSQCASSLYHWIDGVERLELYERGGYHPVMIDDLLHNRYRIIDKLGFGGYSTVWFARDENSQRLVAVKVGISGSSSPQRELKMLQELSATPSCSDARVTHANFMETADDALPRVLDAFEISGPNGTHTCYTLMSCGGSLREASFSRLFPIQVARALAAKLTRAVASIHSRGIVHGGLSLYNIRNTLRLELMKKT